MNSTKKLSLLCLVLILSVSLKAQTNIVDWSHSIKKLNDTAYIVTIKAAIKRGWHIYAQQQPANAISTPVTINFSQNPLVQLKGNTVEQGKLVKYIDSTIDVAANEYENGVRYVQRLQLKAKVKTDINVSVRYQVCNNQKCLPLATVAMQISLQ